MTSLSLHYRTANPNRETVFDLYKKVATHLYNNVLFSFNEIVELAIDPINTDKIQFTIQDKQLEPLVQRAIEQVCENLPLNGEMEKAVAVVKKHFVQTQSVSLLVEEEESEESPSSIPFEWFNALILSVHEHLMKSYAEEIIPLPLALQTMCCYYYALRAVGENFEELTDETDLPEFLEKRGYEIVVAPIPGDLILFLDEGAPCHLGVCREKGFIESKWGNGFSWACLHSLENTPEYGSEILYFRKK